MASTPAGWYEDGTDRRRRYWDGLAWTDQYEPGEPKPEDADLAGVASETPARSTPRPPRPAWVLPLITGVVGLLVGAGLVGGSIAVGSLVAKAQHDSRVSAAAKSEKRVFTRALADCGLADDDDSKIADGGYTLTLDQQGEEDFSGISIEAFICLEDSIKMPESVKAHVAQTTSMDGRQTESWGKITFSWSYHPDRGVDSVYTLSH